MGQMQDENDRLRRNQKDYIDEKQQMQHIILDLESKYRANKA